VSLLLKAGADPNESNAWAKTPLMAAAQADQPEAARLLLERGADPEAVTIPWNAVEGGVEMFAIHTGGRTALMYAAAHADPALISLLLDRGARPQDRDSSGRRACDYLADNPALTDTDRRAAGATLCR
jgi:ankyrin repeat protein